MLIISFDSVGDDDYDNLLVQCPAVSALTERSEVIRGVSTVFVSNTYPVHTSVATGAPPGVHGVISNTRPFPEAIPVWNSDEKNIKVATLWQAAAKKGIDAAAVFWPVTAYSRTIKYNMPEVQARPGKSQIMTSLKAGSKLTQLKLFMRHREMLDGINQPNLDNFATACMADILREHKPGLALIHLTAFDFFRHKYGKTESASDMAKAPNGDMAMASAGGLAKTQNGDMAMGQEDGLAMAPAYEALNKNLSILLEAAGSGEDVIVFSDHGQFNVHTEIDPNRILTDMELLRYQDGKYAPGESGCFFECCGGVCFFHPKSLAARTVDEIRAIVARNPWFRRFLTHGELCESGYADAAFGVCSNAGYAFAAPGSHGIRANHGYTTDMRGYNVFYIIKGFGREAGAVTWGGSLLDIAPLVARRMGLELAQV
jgi:predicted AlkP superfamily pyrophosphatase or phosphodiesterase